MAKYTTKQIIKQFKDRHGDTFDYSLVDYQGTAIKETIQKAIDSNEGQTIWLTSTGKNEKGEQVSEMQFEWTIKVRG